MTETEQETDTDDGSKETEDNIVLITGSNDITDKGRVNGAIGRSKFDIAKVVTGDARGVDRLAEEYAVDEGLDFERYDASPNGVSVSGSQRNREMVLDADKVIVVRHEDEPDYRKASEVEGIAVDKLGDDNVYVEEVSTDGD